MKAKKVHSCQNCPVLIPVDEEYCDNCILAIEHDALSEMYGNEDADYFQTIGWIPGDN